MSGESYCSWSSFWKLHKILHNEQEQRLTNRSCLIALLIIHFMIKYQLKFLSGTLKEISLNLKDASTKYLGISMQHTQILTDLYILLTIAAVSLNLSIVPEYLQWMLLNYNQKSLIFKVLWNELTEVEIKLSWIVIFHGI